MSSEKDTRFFGHPLGLSTLFFTEFWERFGYYGMRSLLVLFMIAAPAAGGFGFDDGTAYAIYGLYTASVYGWSLPGGWLADRFLGQRHAVLVGGILIAIGYLMLAVPVKAVFFSGLVMVVFGTGLLKPNISTIVGQLYSAEDTRRESGFSIFYVGINLGAFVAPLVCGYVGQRIDWRLGFALAGFGMAIGVVWFTLGRRWLGDAGRYPVPPENEEAAIAQKKLLVRGGVVLAVVLAVAGGFAFAGHLSPLALNNAAGIFLVGVTVVLFGWMFLADHWSASERRRLIVILILFIGSGLFWSAFEQAGSSLSVFAQRHTNNVLFGFEYPASWYQSMNAFYIIIMAAAFAWIWLKLGSRNPSSTAKFSLALLAIGVSFLLMMTAAGLSANGVKVSPLWLAATYFLHTVGELCLSPVGLAAYTRLAPVRVAGFMMGVWFLSLSTGNYLGGKLAALYGDLPMQDLFRTVAIFMLVAGTAFALLARPASRWEKDAG